MDNRTISIVLPTYNRYQLTIDSFAQVLNDERIAEVVIVDDASTDDSYKKLQDYFYGNEKVKIYRNFINIDCYANKHMAVELATSEFVAVWDSDNIFGTDYLDAIYAIEDWDKHTFYLPEFARPHFSAVKWSGLTITKENVAQYIDTNLATNLNAFNLFINREEYLRVWDGSVDPITSDSIFFSKTWLAAGKKIYVTPNLQYFHRVGNHGSHYVLNQHRTVDFHKNLMQELRLMR